MQVRIDFADIPVSEALRNRIEARIERLAERHSGITGCHVVVAQPHRHHRNAAFTVHIDLTWPGHEVVISKNREEPEHADAYVAVRDAFDALERKLKPRHSHHHGRYQVH